MFSAGWNPPVGRHTVCSVSCVNAFVGVFPRDATEQNQNLPKCHFHCRAYCFMSVYMFVFVCVCWVCVCVCGCDKFMPASRYRTSGVFLVLIIWEEKRLLDYDVRDNNH